MRHLLVSEHWNSVDLVDIAWLLDYGDVVGASEPPMSRQAWAASDPRELMLWARAMSLRGRRVDTNDSTTGLEWRRFGRSARMVPECVRIC